MIKSDKIDELAKAIVKVQSRLQGAIKDSSNPFFKSKYADLASNWDAAKAAGLHDEGLSVIQTHVITDRGTVVVETTLLHISGQYITGQLEIPCAPRFDKSTNQVYVDPQAVGSAITYARRYSLAAIIGISPEDDDGNKAAGKAIERPVYKPVPIPKTQGSTTAVMKDTVSQQVPDTMSFELQIQAADSIEELNKLVPQIHKQKETLGPEKFKELQEQFRNKKSSLSQKG